MKRFLILVLAAGAFASFSGCQKIKRIFVKPPAEGVIHESSTVRVYGYKSSVDVNTTPRRMMEKFSDFSELEKLSGTLQIEVADPALGGKITEQGKYMDVNLKLLVFEFPCRVICLKFEEDKELMLLVLTEGTWALLRLEFTEIPGGSRVSLDVIGSPSKSLAAVLDNSPLIEATARRLDLFMALIQKEFDPEIDVKELTDKGIRGELYEKFLQFYRSSIWINAPPEKVAREVIAPDNINDILNTAQSQNMSECLNRPENRRKWEKGAGEPVSCPAIIRLGGLEWKFDSLTAIDLKNPQEFLTIYGTATVADILFKEEIILQPELGGSKASMIISVEPPGSASGNIMDIFIMMSGLPKLMENILMTIKAKVEGVG